MVLQDSHSHADQVLSKEAGIGAFFSIGALAFYKGGEFISRLILARIYTPADFGIITFSLAFLYIGVSIMMIGLEQGIIRYVAYYVGKGEHKKATVSAMTSGVMVIVSGFAVSFLLWFGNFWLVNLLHQPVVFGRIVHVLSFAVIPTALSIVVRSVLTGIKKMYYVALVSAIEKILLVVGLLILAMNGAYEVETPFWVYVAAPAGSSLVGLYFLIKHMSAPIMIIDNFQKSAQELLSYSWSVALGSLLNPVRLQGELLIMGYFLSSETIGGYSAASLIAGIMLLPVYGCEKIMTAIFTGLFSEKRVSEIRTLYQMGARWFFLFGILALGAIALDAERILESVFGQVYGVFSPVLLVLVFSSTLNLMSATQGAVNYAFGYTRVILVIFVVGTVTHTLLGTFFVSLWGGLGMAWARVIAIILSEGVGLIAIYRYHRIIPFQRVHLPILLLAGIAWVVCYNLKSILPFFWVGWVSVYLILGFSAMILFCVMLRDDIRPILQFSRKLTRTA